MAANLRFAGARISTQMRKSPDGNSSPPGLKAQRSDG